ncbi:MAG: methyltransferase domain-containing protein [Anaerolineaceae bacterium]|nr:methyltransferase domain-containing protein [Anaerolineaceae bacterium]
MKISDLISRVTPAPWNEGDNIPWNEPGFSRRMLKEHLSQEHDAASRRAGLIERHVAFIHNQLLGGRPARILDLGCGPGLYTQRLARLGHTCRGIDFSPASIEYARQSAADAGLSITYELSDLRQANFGSGYDLVMLIYGEFNVFAPDHTRAILNKAYSALRPGGMLLLEPSPEGHIHAQGQQPPTWYSQASGLFSDRAHIVLEEAFWDEPRKAATNRYYIIDAASGEVSRCASSYQAYSDEEFSALLAASGFGEITFYPNLTGTGERGEDFIAITSLK